MNDNSKFDDDLKRAKSFFKKKLTKNNRKDSLKEKNFRDLDDETIKISKLSARIDFLKDSLKKKKTSKIKSVKNKISQKKKNIEPERYKESEKNKDINGIPIINYLTQFEELSTNSFVILKDIEINSKLYLAGNIHKLPNDLIIDLLKAGCIQQKNDAQNYKKEQQKSYFVKETFGLSEIRRSSLRNNKNFKK